MDQESSERFNFTDKVGTQLAVLGQMCEHDENGVAAWAAIRLWARHDRHYPAWLRRYLEDTARFILEDYDAAQGSRRALADALRLREYKARFRQATRPLSLKESCCAPGRAASGS